MPFLLEKKRRVWLGFDPHMKGKCSSLVADGDADKRRRDL
jgi:hypothetical protein